MWKIFPAGGSSCIPICGPSMPTANMDDVGNLIRDFSDHSPLCCSVAADVFKGFEKEWSFHVKISKDPQIPRSRRKQEGCSKWDRYGTGV